jgi:hypothetical protein
VCLTSQSEIISTALGSSFFGRCSNGSALALNIFRRRGPPRYDSDGRPIEIAAARGDALYDSISGPTARQLAFDVVQPANRRRVPARAERPLNLGMLAGTPSPFGRLIAWDPVARKEAWRVEQVSPWNGGTLTTAGNLVFQGTAHGRFAAYARTGDPLWESPVGTGIVAAPVSYGRSRYRSSEKVCERRPNTVLRVAGHTNLTQSLTQKDSGRLRDAQAIDV